MYREPFEKPEAKEPKDVRARAHVYDFMKKSEDYRKPFLMLAADATRWYECWTRVGKSVTARAKLALPYHYQVVESEAPMIVQAFLGEEPYIKYRARQQPDMAFEDALTDFSAMQLDRMQFPVKLMAFTKGLLKQGTAVFKMSYRYEELLVPNKRQDVDPMTGEPTMVDEPRLLSTFDGPDIEFIPLQDFFPDWASRRPGDIASMRGCTHRVWKTLSELKASGRYKNLSELERSVSKKGVANAWSEPYWSEHYGYGHTMHEKYKRKSIEIWEYWGQFSPKQDGELVPYVITVANGDVVIRCEENPYDFKFKPFMSAVNVIQEDEFYGLSELFAIRGLAQEATRLRNSRLDMINLAVNRMNIVDRAAGITPQSLYARPNGIIFTNDINGIREMPAPEVPASAFSELSELSNEIATTAASQSGPQLTQAGKVFGRSATGANMVQQIAASRAGLKVRAISELTLKPMAQMQMQMNRQYPPEDLNVRRQDPNAPSLFEQLPLEAFRPDYSQEILTNMDTDKVGDIERLQMGAQMLQQVQQAQPYAVDWEKFMKQMGRAIFGRSMEKFIRPVEEQQQLQAQAQANEQMNNAMIGQMAPQPNKPGGNR